MKKQQVYWIFIILLTAVMLAACSGTSAEPETAAVESTDPPADPIEPAAEEAAAPEPSPTALPPTPEPAATEVESAEEPEPTAESEPVAEPSPEPKPTVFYFNQLPVELPGMDDVRVENVVFGEYQGQPLIMDIYYPPDMAQDAHLPVVIMVMGFPDDSESLRTDGHPLKDFGQYLSWGRLMAASGLVAVAYQTMQPEDLASVVAYIQEHGPSLNIDAEQIGLWASFSNVTSALSYAMQEEREILKFVVNYYGPMLTPDNEFRELTDALCVDADCYGAELTDIPALRSDLPVFIAKAVQDVDAAVNPSIDHFVSLATAEGIPVTLVEHPRGHAGFDLWEHYLEETSPIIEETLEFMHANFESDPS